ncbi:MAG: shikimate dehydrogenase [Candidatus Methanomethylophilaceae archaeon]|nr:shikimate dehydrogenase [Candidatus Methanomethylophilaceae archaeon]
MRVCTTYGSPVPLRKGAEMHEIRLDVFDRIPEGVGEESVVTLCGRDPSVVPGSFAGLVDVGERDVSIPHRKIRSFHDFERTPDRDGILAMLGSGDQEISKGAFKASSFVDLCSILDASKALGRKHVLLGMGPLGEVTRIRQSVLGNEFTFGYQGEPTAPGQFSADEMEAMGDGCVLVGITGHPLSHTLSPPMQNAAIRKAGINGRYLVFDSPSLDRIEDAIRGYGIRGMNVTIPYKQKVMEHLDRISGAAGEVGAVNTIVNDDGVLSGENTDVAGVLHALSGVELKGSKALVMGSGGASRAAVYALARAGADVSVSGRNGRTVAEVCAAFGAEAFSGGAEGFDVVVNCTPIGLVEGEYPSDLSGLRPGQAVLDMVYGRRTPLIARAEAAGCRLADGADMLAGQGAESFKMWFGRDADMEAMREALR